ncbi:MAG: hypothetical protein JXA67_13580 [Micromonosporaceae bacterium]|nr:hypothetical protein [Micromonosporaceae bacterium]
MNSAEGRQLYITELERQLQQPLEYPRHTEVRHDIYAFVNVCMEHQGALRRFFGIVKQFHPNSRPITDAERLLSVIEQPYLLADDADALAALISPVPQRQIRAIWADIPQCQRQPTPDWSDPQSVVERLQIVSGLVEDPRLLIQFATRLARVSDNLAADVVYQWIQRTSERLGLSPDPANPPRQFGGRAASTPAGSQHQHPPTATDATPEDRVETRPDPSAPDQWGASPRTTSGRQQPRPTRIWGGVPLRNPHFTGREELLSRLHTGLREHSKASVLPQTLHGYGGVGKTQLAIEYVYRYSDEYQLIWWINAEHQGDVLSALDDLGR